MSITFPSNPSRFEIAVTGGTTWQWDGYRWAPTEDVGYQGSLGFRGSVGYTSSVGYFGSTGYRGSEGYQGSVGFRGSAGVSYFQNTTPSTLIPGELWFDTDDGFMSAYFADEDTWVGINGGMAGYQGSRGYTGYTGSIGYTGSFGPYGGVSINLKFDTNILNTDTSSGYIKFNNVNPSIVTNIKVSVLDSNYVGIANILNSFVLNSSSNNKAYINVISKSDPKKYAVYSISNLSTSPSLACIDLTVTYVTAYIVDPLTSIFGLDEEMILSFTKNGEVGYTGSKGFFDKEATLTFSNTITFSNNIVVNNAFIATSVDMINYSEATKSHGTVTGATTIYVANGNIQFITLGATPITLTFSNTGMQTNRAYNLTLVVTQDGVGSKALAYSSLSPIKWASGGIPALSTSGNATDILTFFTANKGAFWYGALTGKGFN